MDSCVEKVTVHSQTHSLKKKEKVISSFLENNLFGTDVNVHPLVTSLYYLLDPIVKKKMYLKLVLLHNTFT